MRNLIIACLVLIATLALSPFALAAQIKLAWGPNTESDLAGYKVYYGTASRTYGTPINVGNVTTHTLTGLTQGQTYFIAVTAYDTSSLESGFSNEVNGAAKDPESVSTPGALSGPPSGKTGTSYTYTAAGSSSNLGDSVEYQFDWKGNASDLSPWGSATQSKTWASAGTYNVRSRARCTIHTSVVSNWSSSLTVTIGAAPNLTPPPAVTLISPSGTITTTMPTYTWNAVSNATNYYLWVNDSSGNRIRQWYTAAASGCGSGTGTCSVTPATVLNGGAKQWWVQAKNSAGYSPWSTPLTFTVQSSSSGPPGAATLITP